MEAEYEFVISFVLFPNASGSSYFFNTSLKLSLKWLNSFAQNDLKQNAF